MQQGKIKDKLKCMNCQKELFLVKHMNTMNELFPVGWGCSNKNCVLHKRQIMQFEPDGRPIYIMPWRSDSEAR
jgi:hypothetical protein